MNSMHALWKYDINKSAITHDRFSLRMKRHKKKPFKRKKESLRFERAKLSRTVRDSKKCVFLCPPDNVMVCRLQVRDLKVNVLDLRVTSRLVAYSDWRACHFDDCHRQSWFLIYFLLEEEMQGLRCCFSWKGWICRLSAESADFIGIGYVSSLNKYE